MADEGSASADVVVIGGGIQGLSAAYHLALAGVKDIILVEAEVLGAGSSGRSASMLMLQRENREKIALSQYSYAKYMDFRSETGFDPSFRKIGFLSVVPETAREVAVARARLRQSMGVTTKILTPEDILALVPEVNVSDIVVGVHGPDDGVIDAHAIMQGYAAVARRLGARILQGVAATNITTLNRRVVGVQTTQGPISTPVAVNAAGADAAKVGNWIRVHIPLLNRRRSIFLTDRFPAIRDDTPMVEDAEAEWYYRKEEAGVLMGMGKEESDDVSNTPNWDFLSTVVSFATHRVPILANATIAHGWSGIRPLTRDLYPILGPVDDIEGFYLTCGWGGEGIMHAPAGGRIIADVITGSSTPAFDTSPFLLSRFTSVLRPGS